MPRTSDSLVVVYDSGRFRRDAFLLCDRLRSAGLRDVKVIDGGIAAWAQLRNRPEKLALSRLPDHDAAALILDSGIEVRDLAGTFGKVLTEHRKQSGSAAGQKRGKVLLIAEATSENTLVPLLNGKGGPSFYWRGSPDRLLQLVHEHLAQDIKREAGPAQSIACSAR